MQVPSSFNTKEVFIMSTIRKEYNPTGDISKNLDEILRKNGMEAHLKEVGDSYQLLVMSHDSPEVSYNISKTDALKMMNGGSHASDKKAYNTFVSIVRNDFYVPNNFVHAQSVGSHVNMGLNGYRADIPPLATPPLARSPRPAEIPMMTASTAKRKPASLSPCLVNNPLNGCSSFAPSSADTS